MKEIRNSEALLMQLGEKGYPGKMVPVSRVRDLQNEIVGHFQAGRFEALFYKEVLSHFEFDLPHDLAEVKSLLIVAAPQPRVRVTFRWQGAEYPQIIPPIYSHDTDRRIRDELRKLLKPRGYTAIQTAIPLKLLAVGSGLGVYGRNNISYVEPFGSFHRLAGFYTDVPVEENCWDGLRAHKQCEDCEACQKSCPSGAISAERFLLKGERCLTFHNEREGDFPDWVDTKWHHTLVGCLRCQQVCPLNRQVFKRIENRENFSEPETDMLLANPEKTDLPPDTLAKLNRLDLMKYLPVFSRNLGVLLKPAD